MHGVVETVPYLADAERLFTAEERFAIVDLISDDPQCGVVGPGTGGVRKVRIAASGRGKSPMNLITGHTRAYSRRWRIALGLGVYQAEDARQPAITYSVFGTCVTTRNTEYGIRILLSRFG